MSRLRFAPRRLQSPRLRCYGRKLVETTLVALLMSTGASGQRPTAITGSCTMNGQVQTDRGMVVKNALVRLETLEGERVEEKPATTAGQFFFSSIPKGDYVLVVTADGFETYREAVNMREGPDQYNVSVNLTPLGKAAPARADPPALSDAQAPKQARSNYQRAEKAIAARKYGEARKRLEAAVALYPCYARAQTRLGLVMSQQKDYPDAEAAFRRSISCDPGYLDAYLELGQLLNAEKRYEEAMPVLEQGLRQAPASWEFYCQAGLAQYGLKHYDVAELEFSKAKSLAPGAIPEIDARLADVYLKENSFQKAYASMQEYLKAAPNGRLAARIRTIIAQMQSGGVLQVKTAEPPRQVATAK